MLRKRKNPEVSTSSKRAKARKHEPITDQEADELWQTTLGRIVYGKLVLFIDGAGGLDAIRSAMPKPKRRRGASPVVEGKPVDAGAVPFGEREPERAGGGWTPSKQPGKPVRWRVEKVPTGDSMIDGSAYKGERSVFDENGRLMRRHDALGNLVWRRPPDE